MQKVNIDKWLSNKYILTNTIYVCILSTKIFLSGLDFPAIHSKNSINMKNDKQ